MAEIAAYDEDVGRVGEEGGEETTVFGFCAPGCVAHYDRDEEGEWAVRRGGGGRIREGLGQDVVDVRKMHLETVLGAILRCGEVLEFASGTKLGDELCVEG